MTGLKIGRRDRCPNDAHIWRTVGPRRGAEPAEICLVCRVRFPCARAGCGHADCHLSRGEPLPAGVYLAGTYNPQET